MLLKYAACGAAPSHGWSARPLLTRLCAGAAEAQFPFGPGGGGGGPDCVRMGQTLQSSCAAVQGQLTQNSQQILGATCAQVASEVQKQSSTAQCAPHPHAQDALFIAKLSSAFTVMHVTSI